MGRSETLSKGMLRGFGLWCTRRCLAPWGLMDISVPRLQPRSSFPSRPQHHPLWEPLCAGPALGNLFPLTGEGARGGGRCLVQAWGPASWVAESHGVQIPDPGVLCLLSASLIPQMILTCEVASRLTFRTFYSFSVQFSCSVVSDYL